MRVGHSAAARQKEDSGAHLFLPFFVVSVLSLAACTGGFATEPLVEYSTEINIQGTKSLTLVRQLRAGVYVFEIRELDIDLRVKIDAGDLHTELADAYLRHGLHRTVVSLEQPATVQISLSSVDQRAWRGAAAVRILRWPHPTADAPIDERLLGYMALGKSAELLARSDSASWRTALLPLQLAAAHFEAANDLQVLAEAEYQRGYVEFNLLYDFETARRTAESAEAHFAAAGDEAGVARASVLRALNEFSIAASMGADIPRADQHALLDTAVARVKRAQGYFDANEMHSDAMNAMLASCTRELVSGDHEPNVPAYHATRARAKARGDKVFEVRATQHLAAIAVRQGNATQAVEMLDAVLPLIERDRNPDLYATLIGDLGDSLITLGEFDRALLLHSEALEMFSARNDVSQMARELAALASIQFRSGNVERALTTIASALPLYELAHDQGRLVSALRLAGNAAAELAQPDTALDYLRRAEREDRNGVTIEQTRVLIAGVLRTLGDLRGAEKLLAQALHTTNPPLRADALVERARLRDRQGHSAAALADMREADEIYASLKLDFNRIDTSTALALALLGAGDVKGARVAADTAIGIETRIRVSSASPELRARFLSARYAPYEARIEVELADADPGDQQASWKAFRVAEGLRARSLADRLAHTASSGDVPRDAAVDRLHERLTALQVDLEGRMRKGDPDDPRLHETRRLIDEVHASLEARMIGQHGVHSSQQPGIAESREDVQVALPVDTAVLAYFVGDLRSHAWLLTRNELRHSVIPGRRALQDLVNTFVEHQRAGVRTTDNSKFAPLLGGLLSGVTVKRLLILPDGPLNGLPFAALPMQQGNSREQLIDRFVIASAPSLTLAMRPVAHHPARRTRVAVVSDPVYTPDDRRLTVAVSDTATYRGAEATTGRLERLPYSAIEARAVVRAFAGADVIELAGFNATAHRVAALPSADLKVLHFATHAIARRDAPEQSALFLSEYAADGSPLLADRLTAYEIARSGLRADVVVLSGCGTGDGSELRGEGVLGLTYGFLANGSRTVVSSLWPVEDALTARFMEEFYAAYRTSGRAADALRTAQLLTRGTRASPVWASFVVRANDLP